MEDANLYIILLLAGVIIGGVVAGMLAMNLMRPYPPQPFVPYTGYAAPPASSGGGAFVLLLILAVAALLMTHQWKEQQATAPANDEIRTETPYDMSPTNDGRYTGN
ncbi:MAG: hypothetical protein KAX50_10720 [Saprospiraceae bacterium]|nr:hypothetical protein [Saprospiraceae bacterium]